MKDLLKVDRQIMKHIMTHKNRFRSKSNIEKDIIEYNCTYEKPANKRKRAYKYPRGVR